VRAPIAPPYRLGSQRAFPYRSCVRQVRPQIIDLETAMTIAAVPDHAQLP